MKGGFLVGHKHFIRISQDHFEKKLEEFVLTDLRREFSKLVMYVEAYSDSSRGYTLQIGDMPVANVLTIQHSTWLEFSITRQSSDRFGFRICKALSQWVDAYYEVVSQDQELLRQKFALRVSGATEDVLPEEYRVLEITPEAVYQKTVNIAKDWKTQNIRFKNQEWYWSELIPCPDLGSSSMIQIRGILARNVRGKPEIVTPLESSELLGFINCDSRADTEKRTTSYVEVGYYPLTLTIDSEEIIEPRENQELLFYELAYQLVEIGRRETIAKASLSEVSGKKASPRDGKPTPSGGDGGDTVRSRSVMNTGTPYKVARARLMIRLKKITQTRACHLAPVSPNTFRRHQNRPEVLEEIERLRKDKDFLEEIGAI